MLDHVRETSLGWQGWGARTEELDPAEGLALLHQKPRTLSGGRGLAKVEVRRAEEGCAGRGGSWVADTMRVGKPSCDGWGGAHVDVNSEKVAAAGRVQDGPQ